MPAHRCLPLPCFPPADARRRAAFTLVELVVVVMLLGILAGVAAPKYADSIGAMHLETAAKRLALDLRRARAHAVQKATDCTLTLVPAGRRYGCPDLASHTHRGEALTVNFDESGYRINMAVTGAGGDTITFDWRGETSPCTITLTNNGRTKTVAVDAAGNVEVSG